MTELTTTDAVRGFADAVNGTHYAGKRFVLTRRGKPIAALVPLEDLAQLEAAPPANVCSPPGTAPAAQGENRG